MADEDIFTLKKLQLLWPRIIYRLVREDRTLSLLFRNTEGAVLAVKGPYAFIGFSNELDRSIADKTEIRDHVDNVLAKELGINIVKVRPVLCTSEDAY